MLCWVMTWNETPKGIWHRWFWQLYNKHLQTLDLSNLLLSSAKSSSESSDSHVHLNRHGVILCGDSMDLTHEFPVPQGRSEMRLVCRLQPYVVYKCLYVWHSLMTALIVLFSTRSSCTSSTCLSVHLLAGSVAILISPYRQSFFKNINAKHIPPSYFTFTLSARLLHVEERKVGCKSLVKFSKLPCMNIPQWNCAAMQKSLEIWYQLAEACQNTKKNYLRYGQFTVNTYI